MRVRQEGHTVWHQIIFPMGSPDSPSASLLVLYQLAALSVTTDVELPICPLLRRAPRALAR